MATTVTLKPNAIDISGSTSGITTLQASAVAGTTTITLPAATDTLVGKATTDTLTNKTLTSPTITGGALNGTLGATTPSTVAATTISASGTTTLSGNQIISVTDNTNAALRITQLGTGNALLVEDSANPDSSPFVIDNVGNTFIGYDTSLAPSAVSGCEFQVNSLGSTQASIQASQWSSVGSASAQILLAHSLSGTRGTQTIVTSGTALGKIKSFGSDGTNFIEATSIESYVDGTPGTSDMPGRLVFSTTADGASTPTERMRIDSSGNVGIGTTSPLSSAMLEVSRSTTVLPTATVTADNQVTGWRTRRTGGTYPYEYYIGIRENSTALDFYDNTANALRMRIDSSGNLLVGTTSAFSSGRVCFDGGNNAYVPLNCRITQTTTGTQIGFVNGNGGVGTIQTSGSSTSYNTSSDYRLKENVQPMIGALAKVQALKPCTFKWKVDGSDGQGFIAHELQAVMPDCVSGEKDAVNEDGSIKPQQVDTSFLVATLTAALQETKALIDQQAETINALTARVVALESK